MTEEPETVEESEEENIVLEEPMEDSLQEEEEQAIEPMEYNKTLEPEEIIVEDSPTTKALNNAISYLEGKSRLVVIWSLSIFALSILNFILWNFTTNMNLTYTGTILSIGLLGGAVLGLLISYNVHNINIKVNQDVKMSGLILAIGSVVITLIFILYELSQNPCLTEYAEKNCDVNVSLRAVTTIAVYSGSIGIVMLIYGLGLLERPLVPYALAIAFGGSLILTIVLLMSVYDWIQESVWLLLIPLLFLGLGIAGLHHRRYQLAGFVIGCYISGLAGIGWLIEPSLASGGFLGGGLPLTGSGLLFILRRTDREAREKILKEAEELLETGYPSRSLDASNRLIRRAQQDGVLMQDSRMWLSKARALTGHREYSRSITYYSMALEIDQQNENLWYEKGDLHRKLRQWDEAEECFQNATEIRYTYGDAWLRLAQAKERLEKIEEAEESYVIALELESNHGLAYLGLGRVQAKLDKIKEALKSVENSIAVMPEDYRPYMVRGDIYLSLGDYERADAKGYSKAVNIRPDLKSGWRKLAKVYRAQDKTELLIMSLSRILEIDSEDEVALWERAEAHFESKQLGDAMGDVHKLLAINPGNQKARKFKATILEKLDDREWE